MNTPHTPGPWTWGDTSIEEGRKRARCVIFNESGAVIARIENRVSGRPITEEDQANACLMSAAPLMLVALEAQPVRCSEFDNHDATCIKRRVSFEKMCPGCMAHAAVAMAAGRKL